MDLGERAVALARELIAIDSVSPSLAPTGAGEARLAALLGERLAASGFAVREVPSVDPRRPSLLATHVGNRPGPHVVVNGHLDTVPVEGMPHPFEPRIEGERLFGRGASDMKAGIAGLVVAAEELAARDLPGRLTVALVADEEDGSTGAEAVLAALDDRPDVCLIAEPTWLDLAEAHRGFEVLRVGLAGRAAHSSQPEEGRDVVPALARILTAVVAHDATLRAVPADPQLERGSLMTTVVAGGSAPFTVAAVGHLLVERRTLPAEDAGIGLTELRALAEEAAADGIDVTVESVVRRSPWQRATSGPSAALAAHLADALVAAGRPRPEHRGFPYWMESALWEEAGIPTVVCGPAGGGLHAIDEWVDLAQVRAFPVALVDAVQRFAGESG